MFEIGICEIVAELATHLGATKQVPSHDGYRYRARGLEFKFDVGLSLFVSGKRVERRTYVAYAISGTKVWFKCGKSGRKNDEYNTWINTSNHDSCWRTDGLSSPLNELYFRFAEQINEEAGSDVAAAQMLTHSRFLYRRPWTDVNMIWTKDINDPNRYLNSLLSVDPIL